MNNVARLEYAYGVCPKCKRGNYLRYLIHYDGLIHKPYEIKCINCNSYFSKEDVLGRVEETKPKPKTHYDRLVSMMPEDLADAIVSMQYREGDFCPPNHSQNNLWCLEADGCRSCWLNWLRQEVE